jgi:phosphate acetyltransferase
MSKNFFEKRSHKGVTIQEAREKMSKHLYLSGMLLSHGYVDACIAGSMSPSTDVLRAGLQTVGLQDGSETMSSFFLMEHAGKTFAFGDCAVIEKPTRDQLADIAISTADNFFKLTGQEPMIAMLSHSTLGSATSENINNIKSATEIVKTKRPDLKIEGELQFDAAFDEIVGQIKAPNSNVAGKANVFIFPDLASGNIAYKVAERIGGAKAIGPIVQGLSKPYMDLSRGCKVEDIVEMGRIIVKILK